MSTKLIEKEFNLKRINEQESIMTQGNGYMGIRASFEEDYVKTVRGFFIAGIYNKENEFEVEELANIADIFGMEINLDGENFSLTSGTILKYERTLNFKNGELTREVVWKSDMGSEYYLKFRRFVSLDNLNLVVQQVEIEPLSEKCTLSIKSGINGRVTNSGTQNLIETDKRIIDSKYMIYKQKTTTSNIHIFLSSVLESEHCIKQNYVSERRKISFEATYEIDKSRKHVITKKSIVNTSLDKNFTGKTLEEIEQHNLELLKEAEKESYNVLLEKSFVCWNRYYEKAYIEVESENVFDQTAINFALYHLNIMTPSHDNRFSIGAKGLTGEGYKGHVFWDTEVFIFPFFLYTNPEIAKNLLIYRYNLLNEAKNKANQNGYSGALYPWESCLTGKEETPEFAAIDIKTGKRNKIYSALKEHHISADIPYAVIKYFEATNDEEFLLNYGIKIMHECSNFWVSRCDKTEKPYKILDVIGPDEYTEHIDNNAYTNYLSKYIVEKTIQYIKNYNLKLDIQKLEDFVGNIYIPQINESGILPQDDTFLLKPIIDISKYKIDNIKQTILKDYRRSDINEMQILKQADVIMLMFLLKDYFTKENFEANWNYYEGKTIHDSSLSMGIHSIVATFFDETEKAYDCFLKACKIDLGEFSDCKEGIHAASLGAIYLATIFGFAGINIKNNKLKIEPKMPKTWKSLKFNFKFNGCNQQITIKDNNVDIKIL